MDENLENSENSMQHYSLPDPPDRDKSELLLQGVRSPSISSYFSNFESLDYGFDGTKPHREFYRSEGYVTKLFRGAFKWFLCLLLGFLVAITAVTVNFGVENIAEFKFWLTLKVLKSGSVFGSYLLYTLINCLLVFFSSFIVVYYAPAAAGSGISDVKAYLNGVNVPDILHPRTLIAKVIGSVGAVSASLACGKEGPFVHIGSCLGFLLTQGKKVNKYLTPWIFNIFANERDLRDFATCGAGAGVAAAFRAPVGGVLFALEEMTSWWKNHILWLAFFTCAIVSIVLRASIRYCSGFNCGFFGSGGFILFNIQEGQDSYELFELLPMLLLGVLGGLFGAAFTVANAQLNIWRKRFFKNRRPRAKVIEAVFVAFLTSTIAFCLPLTVECMPCPEGSSGREVDKCPREDDRHSGNYIPFHCGEGNKHNDMATLFFNTQDDSIRSLLSSNNNHEYSVRSLVIYFIFFYFLAILTNGIAIPSGLFIPCILCGASYGRLVGMFVTNLHPHHNIDEGTYALLGAAGFLAGTTRMTVSLCVIMLELTNNLALLPLIMLVLLVAKGVGDSSGVKSIYDLHLDLKGVPFLHSQPEKFMDHITARETGSFPVIHFNRIERVGRIREILKTTTHNGFPLMGLDKDQEERVLGTVLRTTLNKLIGNEVEYSEDGQGESLRSDHEGLRLSLVGGDNQTVDLLPLATFSLHIVDENLPASDVYTMFRELQLRHMYVVERVPRVVGIVTRKDLLPDVLEAKFPSNEGMLSEILFDDRDGGREGEIVGVGSEAGISMVRRFRRNENVLTFEKGD